MTELAMAETREVVRTGLRPVYIFDEVTGGATRLHEMIGVTHKGDSQLNQLYLPNLEGNTLIEVKTPSGKAYYIPTEPKLLQTKIHGKNALERLDAAMVAMGRIPDSRPMFVTLVNPTKKDSLVQNEKYRVVSTSSLVSR